MTTNASTRILKAATRMFAERGFYRTTLYDVARSARCSEDLIAETFRTKSALLRSVLAAEDAERAVRLDTAKLVRELRSGPDFGLALLHLVDALYRAWDHQFGRILFFITLERPDLLKGLFEQHTQVYYDAIRDRMKIERAKGRLRKDINLDAAVACLIFSFASKRIFEAIGTKDQLNVSRRDMRHFMDIWLHGVLEPGDRSEISTVLQG